MSLYFFRILPWIKTDIHDLESQKHLQSILKQQYKELGNLHWEECTIAFLFLIMVFLWVTRDFSTYSGWEIFFPKE